MIPLLTPLESRRTVPLNRDPVTRQIVFLFEKKLMNFYIISTSPYVNTTYVSDDCEIRSSKQIIFSVDTFYCIAQEMQGFRSFFRDCVNVVFEI